MFGDFFFFKQKTAYEMRISDWSSDVCSSDLRFSARRRDRGEGAGAVVGTGRLCRRAQIGDRRARTLLVGFQSLRTGSCTSAAEAGRGFQATPRRRMSARRPNWPQKKAIKVLGGGAYMPYIPPCQGDFQATSFQTLRINLEQHRTHMAKKKVTKKAAPKKAAAKPAAPKPIKEIGRAHV